MMRTALLGQESSAWAGPIPETSNATQASENARTGILKKESVLFINVSPDFYSRIGKPAILI
ncbi:hypothetical protein, partial [Paracandidimonas soli]|uniref:hypothetical protein n=1 Tax=Paracandidimonas soli TaxID=1917182 RepID=UPI00333FDBAE